jgi:hypothetical protein
MRFWRCLTGLGSSLYSSLLKSLWGVAAIPIANTTLMLFGNTGRRITLASTEGQEGKGLQILDIKVRSPEEITELSLAHDPC